jgi:hypothetical protein
MNEQLVITDLLFELQLLMFYWDVGMLVVTFTWMVCRDLKLVFELVFIAHWMCGM